MSKIYGECLELDRLSRKITALNTLLSNPGFMPVQYLPNGNFILMGERKFTDADITRYEGQELWVLKDGEEESLPLNHKVFDGVAISTIAQRIAWASRWQQYPDRLVEGESAMYVADIDYSSSNRLQQPAGGDARHGTDLPTRALRLSTQ